MKKKINYAISFYTFIGYYIGLTMIVFFGFIEFSRYYSIPSKIVFAILMIYVLVKSKFRYIRKNKIHFVLFWIFWALYFSAIIKAMFNTSTLYHITPLEYMAYSVVYSIIPFLFFSLHQQEDISLNTFKNAIISSGFFFAIVVYLLYGQLLLLGVSRISMAKYMNIGFTDVMSPLALSYASVLVISICTYYLLYTVLPLKIKMYYYGTIVLSLVPFLLGASRGSVIALVLTFIITTLIKGSAKKKIISLIFLIVFFITVMNVAEKFQSGVFKRVLNTTETVSGGYDSESRNFMWESAWNQFLASPIWGDSIQSRIPPYPHNIVLDVLMSTGLLGFFPFIILLINVVLKSIKIVKYRPEHGWVFIVFMQGVVQYMFSGSVYAALYFWAGMGLVLSVKIEQKYKYSRKSSFTRGTLYFKGAKLR